MVYIEGGRSCFYQWDVDQRLIVEHEDVTEVHFANAVADPALVCAVYEEDGQRYADVPNILLQQPYDISAFCCCAECVRLRTTFDVIPRARPADYVYTETEALQYSNLDARVKELEQNGGGGGTGGAVASVNGKTGAVVLTAADVGALAEDELQGAVNDALAQAKESGEFDGSDGIDGKDGENGVDGSPGKDGVSVTHNWNGTTLTVTSASGTSSADLKGSKGDKGDKGDKGSTGSAGPQGQPGKTPVKGVDYYTSEDKAEFSEYIAAELAKRGQLKPEFAGSIEECTDTSKLYVLPDGYIYAYIKTVTEGETVPNFTNLMNEPGAYAKKGYRYSNSSATFKEYAAGTSLVFPYKAPSGEHVFRVRGGAVSQYSSSFYLGDDNQTFPHVRNATVSTNAEGDVVYTTSSSTEINGYLCICVDNVTDVDGVIVTLNEAIVYTTTEGGVVYKWANTGHAFVPADYESRILDIEENVSAQAKHISDLEKKVENIGTDESEEAAINRIKNWQHPIFEDAPVFMLSENKPALTASDMTTAGIYAKYDALMAANPHYIKKVNCGMASDGTTPIYAYHFRQPNPHYLHDGPTQWTEKKPTFLVCSGVHPLEQTGAHSMFHALEEITTNPELFDLKRNLHIIVFPMLNPTAFGDDAYHMRNPNGVQVHHNFEVGHGENGAAPGDRYYGGATPLSIPETQYFDAVMQEYKDSLVCVLSCHNNELDERHGTGVIWCSCATHFTCNLGFRFADKMSIAWRKKHGAKVFDAGIRWANDFVLTQYENPTIPDFEWMFDIITPERQESWDYLIGRSNMSGSGGTEYRQALKYGIHGVNVETCPRCMILDRDYNATNTSNAITMGTETYVNYFRTFMAAFDPKDKNNHGVLNEY